MDERTCGWCGVDISHLKPIAKYCSLQHKKNAASRRHRERNPGYYKRYHGSPARVAWLEVHREDVRAYGREQQRRYRAEHPDAAREWWAANAEKHRLYQANRRSAQSNNPVGISERDWVRLVRRFSGCCAYCGEKPDALHLEHVIPLKRGGRHAIGNVVPACRSCNLSKNALLVMEWKMRTRRYAA